MRQVYIVNATQVVTSEAHPEGVYSTISGYPKTFDSRNYNMSEQNPNGDASRALQVAKAEYYSRLSATLSSDAEARVMAVVTLTRADGKQILCDHIGAFPDMAVAEPEIEGGNE